MDGGSCGHAHALWCGSKSEGEPPAGNKAFAPVACQCPQKTKMPRSSGSVRHVYNDTHVCGILAQVAKAACSLVRCVNFHRVLSSYCHDLVLSGHLDGKMQPCRQGCCHCSVPCECFSKRGRNAGREADLSSIASATVASKRANWSPTHFRAPPPKGTKAKSAATSLGYREEP